MVKKLKNSKQKKKAFLKILLVFVIIILLCLSGIFVYKKFFIKEEKKMVTVEILDSVSDYNYVLSDKDGKLYKEEYEKLKTIIEADEVIVEDYVKQVAKLFVIDLYTMNSKMNKYDIGGAEFYYADKRSMFEQKVMDTLYSTLLDDTYGDRKQELPEVSAVELVLCEPSKYKLGEVQKESYLVKLKINYVKDMGYDKNASVMIVKEDGVRWSVVDFQPTLNPKY